MTEAVTLQQLVDEARVATSLRKNSSASHAIGALQTLLHWLGFDRQLNWDRFGADGDYGNSTAAAVAAFAKRNTSTANGARVSGPLAQKILRRYDALEELKQLAADIDRNRVERHYRRGGGDRLRIAALQTLLQHLGFGAELKWDRYAADGDYGGSTTAALAAFANSEGIDADGRTLTMSLAERMVARLSPHYGDDWHKPSHSSTPVASSLSINSVIGNNNRHYLKVSDGIRQKRFGKFRLGLYTAGSQTPAQFVRTHAARLRDLGVTRSEIKVMIAVAENEGNLDAINTWDNAFLSFGLFQWTAGTGSSRGELPALLARIKQEDRDLFDRYCGQQGLDVVEISPGLVRGYFSLRGNTLRTPAAKAQLRGAPWAFYFWRAGQDPAVQAIEIKHALGRLDQFYDNEDYLVDNRYRVAELVTSEYGVGLILDNHVNRPAYVRLCLARALQQTGLSNPGQWGSAEERRLIDAYLDIRVNHGNSPMTDAGKRARVTRKYLTNGTISDRRGSFKRSSPAA